MQTTLSQAQDDVLVSLNQVVVKETFLSSCHGGEEILASILESEEVQDEIHIHKHLRPRFVGGVFCIVEPNHMMLVRLGPMRNKEFSSSIY